MNSYGCNCVEELKWDTKQDKCLYKINRKFFLLYYLTMLLQYLNIFFQHQKKKDCKRWEYILTVHI